MRWQILRPVKPEYCFKVNDRLGLVIIASEGESEVTVDLTKTGARALILGLIDSSGNNSLNLKVTTVHQKPNTHAETMIHGLVTDQAQAQIKGLIRINKQAQRVTDFLTERILLLSDQARAIAEPELEIEADEVRASHAATVSSLDKEELFYLMSRGLTLTLAQQLITAGFLDKVINRIDDDKIKGKVCSMLKK